MSNNTFCITPTVSALGNWPLFLPTWFVVSNVQTQQLRPDLISILDTAEYGLYHDPIGIFFRQPVHQSLSSKNEDASEEEPVMRVMLPKLLK